MDLKEVRRKRRESIRSKYTVPNSQRISIDIVLKIPFPETTLDNLIPFLRQ